VHVDPATAVAPFPGNAVRPVMALHSKLLVERLPYHDVLERQHVLAHEIAGSPGRLSETHARSARTRSWQWNVIETTPYSIVISPDR